MCMHGGGTHTMLNWNFHGAKLRPNLLNVKNRGGGGRRRRGKKIKILNT